MAFAPQSPLPRGLPAGGVQVKTPVRPWKFVVAYIASRKAWRPMWSVPSGSATATFVMAAATMFTAS